MDGPARQEKHMEIAGAINRLSREITILENFIQVLTTGEQPKEPNNAGLEGHVSFNTIYASLREVIEEKTDRVGKATAQLREIIL